MARCTICRAKNAQACARCKNILYCSKECQRIDWDRHKTVCKARAEISPRPTEEHCLALYFPEFEPKPRLIWVKVPESTKKDELMDIAKNTYGRGSPTYPYGIGLPQIKSYLGVATELQGVDDHDYTTRSGNDPWTEVWDIKGPNPRNGAPTGSRQLMIWGLFNAVHCDYAMCLQMMVAGTSQQWRGPLVCMAVMPEGFVDVTMADLVRVVDEAMWGVPGTEVSALKVDDSGDEDDEPDEADAVGQAAETSQSVENSKAEDSGEAAEVNQVAEVDAVKE